MTIKKSIYFFKTLFICSIIEIVVFNFTGISSSISNYKQGLKETVLSMKAAELVNWKNYDNKYVSDADPMIIFHNLDTQINTIEISVKGKENLIEPVSVFYVNDVVEIPQMVFTSALNDNWLKKNIGMYIHDLRIDLGEHAGIEIEDCMVTINKGGINFSISRLIAMMLIYYITNLLFMLHKSPDYNAIMKIDDKDCKGM